ncbi:hypothetical protein TYRP_010495 [Tyrophagus putrescentiae]|nr:hypothetical protein TYRP_010495 [Tyrophagus putrescentiae]
MNSSVDSSSSSSSITTSNTSVCRTTVAAIFTRMYSTSSTASRPFSQLHNKTAHKDDDHQKEDRNRQRNDEHLRDDKVHGAAAGERVIDGDVEREVLHHRAADVPRVAAEVITSSLNAPASPPFKPPPLLDRFVATKVVEPLTLQPSGRRANRFHRKRNVIRRNPLPDCLQVTVTSPPIVVQSQTGHFGREKLDKRIGGGNRCELISLQFKRLQRSQASKSISFQVDQRIGAQVKDHQATEAEKRPPSGLLEVDFRPGRGAEVRAPRRRTLRAPPSLYSSNNSPEFVQQLTVDQVDALQINQPPLQKDIRRQGVQRISTQVNDLSRGH